MQLGAAVVVAARWRRWRRLDLQATWSNAALLAHTDERHSADPLSTVDAWGGGWLTELALTADVEVARRAAIHVGYLHGGQGRLRRRLHNLGPESSDTRGDLCPVVNRPSRSRRWPRSPGSTRPATRFSGLRGPTPTGTSTTSTVSRSTCAPDRSPSGTSQRLGEVLEDRVRRDGRHPRTAVHRAHLGLPPRLCGRRRVLVELQRRGLSHHPDLRAVCVPPLDPNLFGLLAHEANHVIVQNALGRPGTYFVNEGLASAVLSERFGALPESLYAGLYRLKNVR